MLTLGTIPIIEKSVGFDRTLYHLPALLVEDFAMVTTELLREAYIEAIYQADLFQYNRLKQSYWSNLLYQIRYSMIQSYHYSILSLSQPNHGCINPNMTKPYANIVCTLS